MGSFLKKLKRKAPLDLQVGTGGEPRQAGPRQAWWKEVLGGKLMPGPLFGQLCRIRWTFADTLFGV